MRSRVRSTQWITFCFNAPSLPSFTSRSRNYTLPSPIETIPLLLPLSFLSFLRLPQFSPCPNGTTSACISAAPLLPFYTTRPLASSGVHQDSSQLPGTGPFCDLTNDQANNVHNLFTFPYCPTRLPCTSQIKYALFGPPLVDSARAHNPLATSQVCCHLHGPVNNDSFGSGCLFACTTPCTFEANVQQ
jgi:hypothetical protein